MMAKNFLREIVNLRRSCPPSGIMFNLRCLPPVSSASLGSFCRHFSRTSPELSKQVSEDRIEMYVDPDVQSLLKQLTAKDYHRVFRKRKVGQRLKEPKYSFMTEEQLQETLQEADRRADRLLQMPPVLRPRQPIDKVLSFDPHIQGLEKSTVIFTDITMNVSDRDRLIVARDPDGILRYATWDERERMNQIYFPRDGKDFDVPKMFSSPEVLRQLLSRASEQDNTYEFVLDRACLQFEPDDPLFVDVCEAVYDEINEKRRFDFLKSTRHYGPFVFYLARTRKMDNLLLYSIEHDRISSDASPLVSLFHLLFPESKSKLVTKESKGELDKLRAYIELDAIKRSELELALNAFEERRRDREQLESELIKSHGIQPA